MSKLARVYRLEDDAGRGVYISLGLRFGHAKVREVLGLECCLHPTPDEDIKFMRSKRAQGVVSIEPYRFGFASEYQLYRWFSREQIAELASKYNIHLRQYEVPAEWLITGDWQVAFHSEHATRIEPGAVTAAA